jgi:hypothetical protein
MAMSRSRLNLAEAVLDSNVRLQCCSENLKAKLKEMGCHSRLFAPSVWEIPFSNDSDSARNLQELRDLDFLMSGGSSGWPPAAIFQHLRSKSLVEGNFKEVLWKSKEEPVILEQ